MFGHNKIILEEIIQFYRAFVRIYKTVIESRQLLPLGRENIVQKV